ncbi:hypothetical protein LOK49_LG01G02219 [Camellia lanceoleosa]|uniref:Uncharacterized protein n=1 Tax=Camellia lanceoleosa TaxID=1840588 RepID=A0ACC0J141_9ERIC|nr:hypothetical protein LOK49_LG01G02219 [Camellia lanceoleosa]
MVGIEGIVVGMVGSEVAGSGGRVNLGTVDGIWVVGSGGNVGIGKLGIVGIVGKGVLGNGGNGAWGTVGIAGSGGSVTLGIDGIVGTVCMVAVEVMISSGNGFGSCSSGSGFGCLSVVAVKLRLCSGFFDYGWVRELQQWQWVWVPAGGGCEGEDMQWVFRLWLV